MVFENIFKKKSILITGGTGFLGRQLIKDILKYNPAVIRVFSRDEVKHHKLKEWFLSQKDLSHLDYDDKIRNLIGDVRDYERLKKAMRDIDIVIHAAALKRLDILEYNVEESIKTNVMGVLNVVNAALAMNVEKCLFVSTDKACSPVNSYGACKFVGERIFTESNYGKGKKRTIFTCVRYGNVLESTGSVIPFFEDKIKAGQNIPLTDPRMSRFIISPEQATDLVFKALKYAIGGEVFVPKLPSFKIVDLIQILKEKHNANNDIEIIGVRPGEKIHELMVNYAEIPRTFRFKNLLIIRSSIEKYLDTEHAEYFEEGEKINEDMIEYSSKDSLINKEKVKELFQSFGLL